MAKLAITLCAALFLVASAYAHRTITVEIDEEDFVLRGRCGQQIQRADLSQCERFITQSRGRRQDIAMVSDVENQSHESLQRCCSQMRDMDDECQCRALKEIVQEQEGGHMERQGRQQVMQRVREVVSYCHMPEQCHWGGSSWFWMK